MNAITQAEIDQQVFDLYDEYCHGRIDRREFLRRAGALGAAALAMALGLMPDYARAQTISFTDSRIKAQYVTYASPGGNGEKMRGYLVQPAGQRALAGGARDPREPRPESVRRGRGAPRRGGGLHRARARRPYAGSAAIPATTTTAATLQAKLDQAKLRTDMLNGAQVLEGPQALERQARRHRLLLGRRHDQLSRRRRSARTCRPAAPFYGAARGDRRVAKIKAPMLAHLAENDPRINEMYPTYEEALKKAGVRYEIHMYPARSTASTTTRRRATTRRRRSWRGTARSRTSRNISCNGRTNRVRVILL